MSHNEGYNQHRKLMFLISANHPFVTSPDYLRSCFCSMQFVLFRRKSAMNLTKQNNADKFNRVLWDIKLERSIQTVWLYPLPLMNGRNILETIHIYPNINMSIYVLMSYLVRVISGGQRGAREAAIPPQNFLKFSYTQVCLFIKSSFAPRIKVQV